MSICTVGSFHVYFLCYDGIVEHVYLLFVQWIVTCTYCLYSGVYVVMVWIHMVCKNTMGLSAGLLEGDDIVDWGMHSIQLYPLGWVYNCTTDTEKICSKIKFKDKNICRENHFVHLNHQQTKLVTKLQKLNDPS